MSSISLDKRAEKVGKILLDKGINTAPVMRVGNFLDISGSMDMSPNYIISSGKLQQAFSQTMGVAVKFDDNGELDVWTFNTGCKSVGTATPKNYETFVKDNSIRANGGTNYAPIIDAAIDFYFGKKKGGFLGFGGKADNTPVLVLIHTDGEPSDDYYEILRALERAQAHPMYFHFVGVGGGKRNFPTIAKLADALPNVGEVYLPRFDMSDDDVYSQVICDELVEWIGGHTG